MRSLRQKGHHAAKRFLLQGKRSGIFLPRQRAVRALAELGAKDVLLDYLTSEEHIVDPVAAHGEEAVKNTAARALGAWRTEDVFEALRHILQCKYLVERSKRCVSSGVRRLCRS